jgi:hypothetical protein
MLCDPYTLYCEYVSIVLFGVAGSSWQYLVYLETTLLDISGNLNHNRYTTVGERVQLDLPHRRHELNLAHTGVLLRPYIAIEAILVQCRPTLGCKVDRSWRVPALR